MNEEKPRPSKPDDYTAKELSDKIDELDEQVRSLTNQNEALFTVMAALLRYVEFTTKEPVDPLLIYVAEKREPGGDPMTEMTIKLAVEQLRAQLKMIGLWDDK